MNENVLLITICFCNERTFDEIIYAMMAFVELFIGENV